MNLDWVEQLPHECKTPFALNAIKNMCALLLGDIDDTLVVSNITAYASGTYFTISSRHIIATIKLPDFSISGVRLGRL